MILKPPAAGAGPWNCWLLGRGHSITHYQHYYLVLYIYDVPGTSYFLIQTYWSYSAPVVPLPDTPHAPLYPKSTKMTECHNCRRVEQVFFGNLRNILNEAFPNFKFNYYEEAHLKHLLQGKY